LPVRPTVLLALLAVLAAGCLAAPSQPLLPPLPTAPFAPLCGVAEWPELCAARTNPQNSPTRAEIDLAVNPKDPSNVIVSSKDLDRAASNCVWAVPAATKDAGGTWTSSYMGGTLAERRADPANPLYAWDCITDPILLFDQRGIAYYFLQTYHLLSDGPDCMQTHLLQPLQGMGVPVPGTSCGYSFYLAVSTDGGVTWPTERILPAALADGFLVIHDYPRMLDNPKTDTVCAVWNAVGQAGINPYVSCTRDQGRSVAPPVLVTAPGAPRSTAFRSGFAAARDGTVYMTVSAFDPTGTSPGGLMLAISNDDAKTFGTFRPMFGITPIPRLPHTHYRAGTFIELAVDNSGGPHAGRLHAVWEDARDGNQSDILAAWTDDEGLSWSPPVKVNQDRTGHAQWMARVRAGDDGTVHVLYMDRQYDPADTLYDATYAWSTDGGATWGNRRISTVSSDGDLGIHQNGFPFIGDYVGVGTVGDHLYLGFPTTATGKPDLAVAHLTRSAG
jgi:hypothetical protein